jgi:hypothetical protein
MPENHGAEARRALDRPWRCAAVVPSIGTTTVAHLGLALRHGRRRKKPVARSMARKRSAKRHLGRCRAGWRKAPQGVANDWADDDTTVQPGIWAMRGRSRSRARLMARQPTRRGSRFGSVSRTAS